MESNPPPRDDRPAGKSRIVRIDGARLDKLPIDKAPPQRRFHIARVDAAHAPVRTPFFAQTGLNDGPES